ncbi:MAG: hypothetical protein ACL7AX_04585 [Candidatus Arsenophonus phytopathogenicus]
MFTDEEDISYIAIESKYNLIEGKNRLDMIAREEIQIDNKVMLNVPVINITTKGSIYFNSTEKELFKKPLHYDRLAPHLKSIYDLHDKEYERKYDIKNSEQD